MNYLIAVFIGFSCSFNAIAGDCDWAKETPEEDAKYQYFVAREYSKNIADAQNKAERDIDNQLGRLFGSRFITQSEYYQDESSSVGTTRTTERPVGSIILKGLEKQKSSTEKTKNGYFACIQYRYKKTEIEKEKERLANIEETKEEKIIYNETEGNSSCRGAPVFINTSPSGAFVTLNDGEYQGYTPIKFANVCYGEYSLMITKDNYENESEKLIVNNYGKDINKKLRKGVKEVKITTDLGNSTIFVNGVDMGEEPVKIKAEYGITQEIEAINSEANSVIRKIEFYKDSQSDYIFYMEKKPASIDFRAFRNRNKNVDIYIDGKKLEGNSIFGLEATTHKITFKKNGFRDIEKEINLKGGENKFYQSDTLKFVESKKDTWHNEDGSPLEKTYLGYSLGGNFGGSGYLKNGFYFDFFIEKKAGICYFRIGVLGDFAKFTDPINVYRSAGTGWYNYSYLDASYSDYFDVMTFNLGVNITEKLSLYGIYKIGLSSDDEMVEDKYPSRFGIGFQYDLWEGISFRTDYSTGTLDISGIEYKLNTVSSYFSFKF